MMFNESLGWGALRIQRLNRRIVMSSPRKTQFGKFLLVLFALASILVTVAFAEGDAPTSAAWGTVVSLLPPVVAIVLALITKEVYSSLFLGIMVGCFLYVNGNPLFVPCRILLTA